jgi:primosomal protein N' (replication factor Y)
LGQSSQQELNSLFHNKRENGSGYKPEVKFGFEKNHYKNREVDILSGTQMLAKGLDFLIMSLVGIMNADNMLYHPDFRAFERSFQMMVQVSGRSGRSEARKSNYSNI